MKDILADSILEVIRKYREPLETKEISQHLEDAKIKEVTRTKLFYRLTNLRGEGLIKGKFVGPGKGVWIWWTETIFVDKDKEVKK